MFLRGHKANLSNAKLRFNSRSVWSVDRDEAINVVAPSSSHDKSLLSSPFFSPPLSVIVSARYFRRPVYSTILVGCNHLSKGIEGHVPRRCTRCGMHTNPPDNLWPRRGSRSVVNSRASHRGKGQSFRSIIFSSSSFFSNFLLSLLRDCARTEDWSERPMTCGNYALGLVHTRQEWNRRGKIRSSIGFNFVRECVLGEFTMGSSDTIRWKR